MVEGLCRPFLGSGLAAVCFLFPGVAMVLGLCWVVLFFFLGGGRTVGDGTARLVGDFLVYVS